MRIQERQLLSNGVLRHSQKNGSCRVTLQVTDRLATTKEMADTYMDSQLAKSEPIDKGEGGVGH